LELQCPITAIQNNKNNFRKKKKIERTRFFLEKQK
jgi:hypothetical protein